MKFIPISRSQLFRTLENALSAPFSKMARALRCFRVEAEGNVGLNFETEGIYATADAHPHIEVK